MNKTQLKRIQKEGFSVPDLNTLTSDSYINGLILQDGTFILCPGFNMHMYIYPLLYSMKLVTNGHWVDDTSAIHISSRQLHGKVAYDIEHGIYGELTTEKQLDTLFAMRKMLDGMYGDGTKVSEVLYSYVCRTTDLGGKYNGLAFLQRFYTNINLPYFSLRKFYSTKKICIRTSPKHSLPGLLNSKFDVKRPYDKYIEELKQDFDVHKDLRADNELHYFFQEQLDGANGVCHVRGRNRRFSYAASVNIGDIVKGKTSRMTLSPERTEELRTLATELAQDFNKSIQLEFVLSEGKLYIVQLRLLQNEPEETVSMKVPENAICFGKTFSHGNLELNVKDILVIDAEGDSKLLLGKKALIVTNKAEFSHLLALSKALKIPSMYATGKVTLPKKGKVKVVCYNEKAWII